MATGMAQLLSEKGVTGYRLSKESGVPQTTITDICSGRTCIARCSAETVYRIAKVLGVSMESLVDPYCAGEARDGAQNEAAATRDSLERLAEHNMKANLLKLLERQGAESADAPGRASRTEQRPDGAPPVFLDGIPAEDPGLRDSLFFKPFDKKLLDTLLSAVAREYSAGAGGGTPTELILTGGAALLNTCRVCAQQYDIGVVTLNSPELDAAIDSACRQLAVDRAQLVPRPATGRPLPLEAVVNSNYCKTFSGVLSVRRLSAEYICASRLFDVRSLGDVGDAARVLLESAGKKRPLTPERVLEAAQELGCKPSEKCEALVRALASHGDLAAVVRACEGKR